MPNNQKIATKTVQKLDTAEKVAVAVMMLSALAMAATIFATLPVLMRY